MVNQPKPTAAIFGGSFDPPHQGHQKIVQKAVDTLKMDLLIILPAYRNPFKDSSMAHAQKRLEWCHHLFDDTPKVVVDDYEISQGKSVRTSQSIRHFNAQYDVKYLIIGADNLSTLTQWHEFEWLNKRITWVIATREGYPIQTEMLRSWRILEVDIPASSTAVREEQKLHDIDSKIKQSVHETIKDKNT